MKLFAFLLVLVGLSYAVGQTNTTSTTYEVYVGFESNETKQWDFHRFFPETLYVRVGDQVVFKSFGTHTVTFNAVSLEFFNLTGLDNENNTSSNTTFTIPLSDYLLKIGDGNLTSTNETESSGVLDDQDFYNVTFSAEGTYNYVCMFHFPVMQGRIIVLGLNESVNNTNLLTPEDVEKSIDDQLNILVNNTLPDLDIIKVTGTQIPPSRRDSSLNTTIWSVRMVGDYFSKATFNAFIPSSFEVSVGDIVEFVNDDFDKHAISFNTSGIWEDDLKFDADQNKFFFNELFFTPHGDNLNYSTGFISSGILVSPLTPDVTNQTLNRFFWVRFTAPGTYPFRDDLRFEEGMVGSITVIGAPSSSTSGPSASSAPSSSSGSSSGTTPSSSGASSSSGPSGSSAPSTSASG